MDGLIHSQSIVLHGAAHHEEHRPQEDACGQPDQHELPIAIVHQPTPVVRQPSGPDGMQEVLPSLAETGPSIAPVLEELQTMDVAFHDSVAPGHGEAGLDRD
jgi:hypothetical protein